jgi:hypothetical protein
MMLEMPAGDFRPPWRLTTLRGRTVWALLLVGLCILAAPGSAEDAKPAGSTTLVALAGSPQSSFALPSLDGPALELARLRGRTGAPPRRPRPR